MPATNGSTGRATPGLLQQAAKITGNMKVIAGCSPSLIGRDIMRQGIKTIDQPAVMKLQKKKQLDEFSSTARKA